MHFTVGLVFVVLGAIVVALVAKRNPRVANPLYAGFFARALLAIIDMYIYPMPGLTDGFSWYWGAVSMAKEGFWAVMTMINTGTSLYIWFMAVMYSLFPPSRLMIQEINALFGALIIYNVWQITWLVWKDAQAALRAAWFAALFPSLILYSSTLLREVAVAYPLSLGVLFLVRWMQDRKANNMIKAAAALLVSMSFHSGGVGILFAGAFWVVGSWLKAVVTGSYVNFARKTAAMIVSIGAVVFVFASGFAMDKFSHIDANDVKSLQYSQNVYSHGRTVYLEDLRADTGPELAVQSPIRMAYFLFAPFPWMISTPSDVVGFIDAAFFFWLAYKAFRARRKVAGNASAVLVLAVFASMAMVFALGVQNYGTAMRHRDKMLPLLIAVAASLQAPVLAARARFRSLRGAGPRFAGPGRARPRIPAGLGSNRGNHVAGPGLRQGQHRLPVDDPDTPPKE